MLDRHFSSARALLLFSLVLLCLRARLCSSQQAPQSVSINIKAAEYTRLESAGQLQLLTSPAWIELPHGDVHLQFTLPRQGLSLVRLAW